MAAGDHSFFGNHPLNTVAALPVAVSGYLKARALQQTQVGFENITTLFILYAQPASKRQTMNPARCPKFLSVMLLGLVMPVHADTMLYSNILGYFSITHTEDCILLKGRR